MHTAAPLVYSLRTRIRAPHPDEPCQRQSARDRAHACADKEQREERGGEDARVVARGVRPEAEALHAARRGRRDVARRGGEHDGVDGCREERDRRSHRDAPRHEQQDADEVRKRVRPESGSPLWDRGDSGRVRCACVWGGSRVGSRGTSVAVRKGAAGSWSSPRHVGKGVVLPGESVLQALEGTCPLGYHRRRGRALWVVEVVERLVVVGGVDAGG